MDLDFARVINLRCREDRKKTISRMLRSLEIEFEIFPAVNGTDLLAKGGRQYKERGQTVRHYKMVFNYEGERVVMDFKPGRLAEAGYVNHWRRLGNMLSHKRCVEMSLDNGEEHALIFEDDARLHPSLTPEFAKGVISSLLRSVRR